MHVQIYLLFCGFLIFFRVAFNSHGITKQKDGINIKLFIYTITILTLIQLKMLLLVVLLSLKVVVLTLLCQW